MRPVRNGVFVFLNFGLAVCVLLAGMPSRADFAVPPPSLVEKLDRDHRRSDLLRVTTPERRFDIHVGAIEPEGLSGISGRRSEGPFPDRIAWSSIERIDRLHSRFRSQQITWFVLGGAIGGLGPIIARGDANTRVPIAGMALGAATGAWLGGAMGARRIREEMLYLGRLAPATALEPPADTAIARQAQPPALPPPTAEEPQAAAPAPAPSTPSPEIVHACEALRPASVLRLHGDFGWFEGRAARVTPAGFDGLQPRSRENAAPADPLTWDRVYSLEKLGNNAGRGARGGAIALGAVGLLAGLAGSAAVAVAGSNVDPGTVLFGGIAIGLGSGATVGALIGSAVPRWEKLYERRTPLPAETPRR